MSDVDVVVRVRQVQNNAVHARAGWDIAAALAEQPAAITLATS